MKNKGYEKDGTCDEKNKKLRERGEKLGRGQEGMRKEERG